MDSAIDFLHKTAAERGPDKRKVKVVDLSGIDIALYGPSDDEEDEDFIGSSFSSSDSEDIEESPEDGRDGNSSSDDSTLSDEEDADRDQFVETKVDLCGLGTSKQEYPSEPAPTDEPLICCLCLNLRLLESEVVQCDACGIGVHEGCYGLICDDTASRTSACSSISTEPWFCESCLAGLAGPPDCELCPVVGGAYKPTDHRTWVHLICALYVSGCTFGDTERLSPVNIYEIGYERYGSHECSLCSDRYLGRTGVAIKCDAGMCHTYFHVTCAQRAGLLCEQPVPSDDSSDDDDDGTKGSSGKLKRPVPKSSFGHGALDTFYAGCHRHSQRDVVKKRIKQFEKVRRQLETFRARAVTLSPREAGRLAARKRKYDAVMSAFPITWTPTDEKFQRLLHTSAGFVRKMRAKTEILRASDCGVRGEFCELTSQSTVHDHDYAVCCRHLSSNANEIRLNGLLQMPNGFIRKGGSKRKTVDANIIVGVLSKSSDIKEYGRQFVRDEVVGKYVLPPSFTPDFVHYYAEREKMIRNYAGKIQELSKACERLKQRQMQLNNSVGPLSKNSHKYKDVLLSYSQCLSKLGFPNCSSPALANAKSSQSSHSSLKTKAKASYRGRTQHGRSSIKRNSQMRSVVSNMKPNKKRPDLRTNLENSANSSHNDLPDTLIVGDSASTLNTAICALPGVKRAADGTLSASHVAGRLNGTVGEPNVHPVIQLSCAKCTANHDQHLLAQCDSCSHYFHLACLDPPLRKMPRKSQRFGWECSSCAAGSTSADSDTGGSEKVDVNAPRKLRVLTKPAMRYLPFYPISPMRRMAHVRGRHRRGGLRGRGKRGR